MNDLCQAVFFATSDTATHRFALWYRRSIVLLPSWSSVFDLITCTLTRIQFSVHVRPDVPTPGYVLPTPSFRFPFLLLISAIYRSQVFISAVRTLRQSLRSEKKSPKIKPGQKPLNGPFGQRPRIIPSGLTNQLERRHSERIPPTSRGSLMRMLENAINPGMGNCNFEK